DGAQPPVLQLANIELAARSSVLRPPQEYVARRLHDALALHHPLALVALELGRQLLEHRRAGFLQLQEQRGAVPAQVQPDGAEGADAADTDHFEGDVLELVSVDKKKPVGWQAFLISVKHAPSIEVVAGVALRFEMIDERRPIRDARLPALDQTREIIV